MYATMFTYVCETVTMHTNYISDFTRIHNTAVAM